MDTLEYLNQRLNKNNKSLTDDLIELFLSIFNNKKYSEEDYKVLKKLIRESKTNIPTIFKNDKKVLENFIEENLNVDNFDEEIWNDELIDKYIKTILDRYKINSHYEVPKTLYRNRKLFYYLLDTGLILIDRNYYFKENLEEKDIEKYVDFLSREKLYYIPNRNNFINNSSLLNNILKKGLINYVNSFKKEAWTEENILLFLNQNKENIFIPNQLYDNPLVLKYAIQNRINKVIKEFTHKAWNDENVDLLIDSNLLEEIEVPSSLLKNPTVLQYYLINENTTCINRFNEIAWTESNKELFKKLLLKEIIETRLFPVNFRFEPDYLNYCLQNKIGKYTDVFLNPAFTEKNILLLKKLLLEKTTIEKIPTELSSNNELLQFCIENKLIDYIQDFKNEAWQMKEALDYINLFASDEDIKLSDGMTHSKLFMHTIMFTDKIDLLVNFSNSCWNDDYVTMLFEIIAENKNSKKLAEELKEKYNSLKSKKIKANFRNYIIENRQSIGNLDDIVEILIALENSNSTELKHIASEVATFVLTKENPIEEFKKIENIFLSNELPAIAKIYNIFRTFHSSEDGSLWINSSSNISPVLKHYSSKNKGSLFCEAIIFSDLLKACAGSNNRSLINYLKKLKESDTLLNDIINGEINVSDLKTQDLIKLQSYLNNLTALYNQTLEGKKKPYIMTNNIKNDIVNLIELYKIDGIDNILDRVVRMYANFIGVKTYDEMIEYINSKVKKADMRSRESEKTPFFIQKGDFIKGINDISFLPNILNNGVVASEFLGSSATKTGDLTPFDTDGSLLQEDRTIDGTFNNNDLAALYYGQTWIVFKTDGKTQITRDNEKEIDSHYEQDKIELFHNGSNGKDHYGIRTGFPSTDIDFIVTREYNSKIGFEIARNGFYIPVIDTKGNVLFTSEMYDNIRNQMNGLSFYGIESYNFSDNLILPGIEQKIKEIDNKDKTGLIRKKLDEALSEFELIQNDKLDGNLSRNIYNFIDIGSTGRGTNLKESTDYDFMLMLDQRIMNDEKLLFKIKKSIMKALGKEKLTKDDRIYNGNFRFKNVQIGDKKIDIDISFEGKTDKIAYTSDMAIKDRLDTMKKTSKEKTLLSIANILIAKELLKKNKIYKPINSETREGGLGGIGVENWILSHGGSLIDASISFLEAYYEACEKATRDSEVLIEFNKIYKIWNFGENYYSISSDKPLHNEFVKENLSRDGLKKMAEVLKNYLKSINIEYERRKVL